MRIYQATFDDYSGAILSIGPPRKYYELTEKGQKILNEMNDYWQDIKTGTDALGREEKL